MLWKNIVCLGVLETQNIESWCPVDKIDEWSVLRTNLPCAADKSKIPMYTKKIYRDLGGQEFQPPRLMPGINQGGHFINRGSYKNHLAKFINWVDILM